MALTKIGATLGGSADVIQVTQNSHGLSLGFPVKVSGNGTYAHASADIAANAEAIGIIIATTTNTMTIALGGRITIDGVLPSGNPAAGTVLFMATSAGKLTATPPTGNNEVIKPMAVVTYLNSEMIMLQHRGEVISTAGVTLANDSVDSQHYAAASIDNEHLADNAVDSAELAAGAVDIAHLSASGSAGSGTFLRGDNQWAAAGGVSHFQIEKAANQTVASNETPQSDTHFTFAIGANETWIIQMFCFMEDLSDGGFKMAWAVPSGATGSMAGIAYQNNSSTSTVNAVRTNVLTATNIVASGRARDSLQIYTTIRNGGTAGTATFQWAQESSNSTGCIMRQHSQLIAHKE